MKKRVLSFILVLATLIGVLGTASITSMAAPTCYQQGDARWGGIYYGKWNLAESGCGILSAVNAINYLTGNFMHPTELAAWAHANNHYNGSYGQGAVRNTLYANITGAFGTKYGFKVTNLTWGTVTNATLVNHLKNGGTAIVHVPNHFMALCGYNASTGQYLVYDSAANPAKRNTSVSGSWLTAAQLNSIAATTIDWFCLVHRNGTGTVSSTTTLYTASASVASGSGSVHFGNNVTSAKVAAGTVINYQTTPAAGYKVSKILVGGTAQTIKNSGGDAVYQFTMPAGNCAVKVTFTKITTTATYTVSASVASGSGSVHFGNNVTSAKVAAGTLINFQTTPSSGYAVSKIVVGGTTQTIKNNGGNAVYQFTMPAGNCAVSVTFSKVAATYTASASVASGSGKVHFGNNVTSANVAAGTVINFQTTPSSGYKVSKILVGGTAWTIKNNGGDAVYQFTMPEGNCGVVVTFTKIVTTSNLYTVYSSVSCGSGSVHFGNNVTSAQVTSGTVINFQTTPAAGYKVSQILVGGTAWTIKNNGGDAVYQFTMPEGNCGVVVTFTSTTTYKVRCGTFSVKANATNLVNQLSAAGFSSYIATVNGQYVVYAGTFSVKANATNFVTQLNAAGFAAYVSTT
ncbi:MAG: SPOR domain-containing protein [Clostridia bacterium]|nr:SPOR domain-containing protein [Clostridia bacterium]